MNTVSKYLSPCSRYVLAVLSGLILTAAFPKWNVAGGAWIAPGLMLFCAINTRNAVAFRLGFTAGFVHALSSLYWLLSIPYTFHGVPIGPGAGWLALSAYVALFHGAWVWACWRILPKSKITSASSESHPNQPPSSVAPILKLNWSQRALWCFCCAVIWVGLEILRSHFLTGFPWNMLGNSQYRIIPLIQAASFGGVYAVSFLAVWMSVSIGVAFCGIARELKQLKPTLGLQVGNLMVEILAPMLVLAVLFQLGTNRISAKTPARSEISIASIQPSIPQTVIWDASAEAGRFQKVISISEQAMASKPDLLVWPESAFPGFSREYYATLTNFLSVHPVSIVLCADDADFPTTPDGPTNYYNSSFLISTKGIPIDSYRKRRLVIFGEYVPPWLGFLKWVTPIDGGFTPGTTAKQFKLEKLTTSVLICFEDVFPHEVREHVDEQTDLLINLTNDGWFGEGACQWQQAAAGVFRAVENGVPLLRCTNNGITCWIDGFGRIRQISNSQNVYAAGFMISQIPLPEHGPRTFYNQHGDYFAWGCAFLSIVLLGSALWKAKQIKN